VNLTHRHGAAAPAGAGGAGGRRARGGGAEETGSHVVGTMGRWGSRAFEEGWSRGAAVAEAFLRGSRGRGRRRRGGETDARAVRRGGDE
jgi:hypothetical protein